MVGAFSMRKYAVTCSQNSLRYTTRKYGLSMACSTPSKGVLTGAVNQKNPHVIEGCRYFSQLNGHGHSAKPTPPTPSTHDHHSVAASNDAVANRCPSVDFHNSESAYASYSTSQLMMSIMIYKICSLQWLVQNSDFLVKKSYKYLPEYLVSLVMEKTFFKQFCAGTNQETIRPTIQHLQSFGVGSILDYAAEADLGEDNKAAAHFHESTISARTYSYIDELHCDLNLEVFEKCVMAVHKVTPEGFAAIKLTALGQPKLLERMSTTIVEIRNFFHKLDVDKQGVLTYEKFKRGWLANFNIADEVEIRSSFDKYDSNKNGTIDYNEFCKNLTVEDLGELIKACRESGPLAKSALTEEEVELVVAMRNRLEKLCMAARRLDVRLMIDAEQSYFQPAIDNMVLDMQRKYNKDFPAVFTTYQCYLKDSLHRIKIDLDRAKREGYWFGAKLVRGAYLVQERARATEKNYPSPICDTLEDTHKSYHDALDLCLAGLSNANVMIASHNADTMHRTVQTLQAQNVDPATCGVYFGQLLGMADNLTFSLGQSGYKAYKYVPYGPVKEVVPYLVRRAQENSTIMGRVAEERHMLGAELRRRWGIPVTFD